MTRRTLTLVGFFAFLAILVPVIAAQPQPKAGNDPAAEIKAAQEERIKLLKDVAEIVKLQYDNATITNYADVYAAERELCNATVDVTDDPEKRIALLTRLLEAADAWVKVQQGHKAGGTVTDIEAFTAKAECLRVTIQLLQERAKIKNHAAQSGGKKGNDYAAHIKAAQEERIKLLDGLVKIVKSQYDKATITDYADVYAADRERCNAKLDVTDDPEKRIALLIKLLEAADDWVKVEQKNERAGTNTSAEIFTTKAEYLRVKIQLLQERAKIKNHAPQSGGKKGNDYAAQIKAAEEERIFSLSVVEAVHVSRYAVHVGEFFPVLAADKDLCKAQLDLYDEPAARVALLEKDLNTADYLVRITDAKVKADIAEEKDLRKAQLEVLRIEVAKVKADIAAEKDLCKAQPSKRLALLEKDLKTADDLVRIADAKVKAEVVPETDNRSAKANYLDVKIQLLRERAKSKAKQGRMEKGNFPALTPKSDGKKTYQEFAATIKSYPYEAPQARKDKIVKNLSKLELDMSKEQVAALIGEPDYSELYYIGEGPRGLWFGSHWMYYLRKQANGVPILDSRVDILFGTDDRAKRIAPLNIDGLKEKGGFPKP